MLNYLYYKLFNFINKDIANNYKYFHLWGAIGFVITSRKWIRRGSYKMCYSSLFGAVRQLKYFLWKSR